MNEQPNSQLPPGPAWQTIAAFLLWRFSPTEVVNITPDDVDAFTASYAPSIPIIFADQRGGKFNLSLVTEAQANELTKLGAGIETVGGEPEAPGSSELQ